MMLFYYIFFTLVIFNKPLHGSVINENIIGDMILDDNQFGNFSGFPVRNGASAETYRWPNGELPYKLSRSLTSHQKATVRKEIGKKHSEMPLK